MRKFVAEGTRIAAVAPSSGAMARALCNRVDRDRPQTIVELGAGTGAITKRAMRRLHPGSELIAVERDAEFMAHLRPLASESVQPVHGDARNIDRLLREHSEANGNVDLVLSGLPIPSLPHAVNRAVLAWFAGLPGAPVWSQLTLMPWVYKPLYQRLFGEVDFQLVLANLPAGGVYHCRHLRPDFASQLPRKTQQHT